MAKVNKNLPQDSNQRAKSIVDSLTEDKEEVSDTNNDEPTPEQRSEAARILGRKGGLKGGKARAEKLSPERRSKIAKDAAAARWGTKED